MSDTNIDSASTTSKSGWCKVMGVEDLNPEIKKAKKRKKSTGKTKHIIIGSIIALIILAILASVVYYAIWFFVHKNAYEIFLNDKSIGIITEEGLEQDLYNTAIAQIETMEGTKVKIDEGFAVSSEFVRADKNEIVTTDYIILQIRNCLTYTVQGYVITVNGNEIGVLNSKEKINNVLNRILDEATLEDTVITEKSFVEPVEVAPRFVDKNIMIDELDLYKKLTEKEVVEKTHTIVKGDTLWSLANANGITLAELLKINPKMTEYDILQIGQIITLQVPKPLLSVKFVTQVTYTEAIPSTTIYQTDSSKYKTYKSTKQEGKAGSQEVVANVIYIDGYEKDRELVGEPIVLAEPVPYIIITGTMELPPKAATGVFSRPISGGTISSYFGSRWDGFHQGLDIAAPKGTTIYASDGGTVIWSGWGDSYGNLVQIDHGNGFISFYGHCSALYVTVGQKVAKGEKIAAVGSTGNSTGNHIHFEIRKNGTPVNPLNYL